MKEVAEVDISGVEKGRVISISVSGDRLAHERAAHRVESCRAACEGRTILGSEW
jgi:hypothetical protein